MTDPVSKPAASKLTYEIVVKAVAWFMVIDQVRKQVTDEADLHLTDSIRQRGVLQPLGARADGRLVWGHRRLRCAIAAGLAEVPVVILHKDMTEGEYLAFQMVENVQRESLSQWDMYQGCVRLLEAHPGMQGQELAKLLSMSPAMVSKWLSPSKTTPTVQDAFKAGKIPLATVYELSKLPPEVQEGVLALKLSHAPREQIEDLIAQAKAKPTAGTAPPATDDTTSSNRASRVKIPLAVVIKEGGKETPVNGTVTLTSLPGEEIGLKETENLLKEAIRAVREAQSKGLGVKAAQAGWRDMAKAVQS